MTSSHCQRNSFTPKIFWNAVYHKQMLELLFLPSESEELQITIGKGALLHKKDNDCTKAIFITPN